MSVRLGPLRLDLVLLLAAIANRAYSVALVVYVYDLTHSSSWVAAAAAARYLPGIATSMFAQPLLGRFSPRDVLVWADVACAIGIATMAATILLGAPAVIPIVLAAIVRASASGQGPAAAKLLPVVAGGRDLSHVAARQASTDKLMLLAGPAIGGLLLVVVSPGTEMVLLSGLFATAAIISIGLPAADSTRPRVSAAQVGQTTPVRGVRGHTTAGIGVFVVLTAVSGFVYGTDTVLLAVLATTRLHLGDAGYGELFAGLGAGGLLAAPAINRLVRRHRLAGWLVLAVAAYCAPSVLIAHTSGSLPVVALEAIRGAGSLAVDVLTFTELQRIVLPQGLPVLTARLTAVVFGAVAAGALTTPLILHGLGTTGTFTAVGTVPLLLAVGEYPMLRGRDARMDSRLEELGPRIAVLEPLGLLQATSRPVLERLAADVIEIQVAAGATVIAEHDFSDTFYVVLAGDLDVFVGNRRVNELHAGDWFGEIGLLEGLPRTATVCTRSACTLYRISGEAFLAAFAQLAPSPTLLDSVAARLASSGSNS